MWARGRVRSVAYGIGSSRFPLRGQPTSAFPLGTAHPSLGSGSSRPAGKGPTRSWRRERSGASHVRPRATGPHRESAGRGSLTPPAGDGFEPLRASAERAWRMVRLPFACRGRAASGVTRSERRNGRCRRVSGRARITVYGGPRIILFHRSFFCGGAGIPCFQAKKVFAAPRFL